MQMHNHNNETQSGGIMLKMPAEEAFYKFISNSSVSLLTDQSSFGIILKLSINTPNIESPYLKFSAKHYNEPVDCILIKLVALRNETNNKFKGNEWDINGLIKQLDTEENFMKEVNIQTDVYFKTMEYLEPLCPATIYANVFKDKEKTINFLDILIENTESTSLNDILKIIKLDILDEFIWLGVFGMEIDNNYVSLHEFQTRVINPNDKEDLNYYTWTEQMAKLQVLNLAIKTGYSQNDFHHGNFLIHQTYRDMYDKLDGKVLIIDFGLASKLSPAHITEIKKYYSKNKFTEALKIFKNLKRSDGVVIDDYSHYWWLYNQEREIERPDSFYDSIMHRIKNKEDIAINKRIHKYNKKHDANPNVYPRLPLSNSIKNQFYQGMIEDIKYLSSVNQLQTIKPNSKDVIMSIPCQKGKCETRGQVMKNNWVHSKNSKKHQTTRNKSKIQQKTQGKTQGKTQQKTQKKPQSK
jgi:hypothetical protein